MYQACAVTWRSVQLYLNLHILRIPIPISIAPLYMPGVYPYGDRGFRTLTAVQLGGPLDGSYRAALRAVLRG